MLFINIILPVFLIIFSGYLLERKFTLDFRTLTNASLYLFSPALVFAALMKQQIRVDLATDIFLFMVLYTLTLLAIAVGTGRLLRMTADRRAALSLSTVMMNVGNFGLPLSWFAFGAAGLEVSVLTFVLFNIPLSTLAIVLAQGGGAPLRDAVGNALRIPIFHALVLALLLKALAIVPPEFVLRPVELLGQAAIPLMLVLLGMQLARTRLVAHPGFLALSSGMRLLLAPAVAWMLTALLGIDGITRAVLILQTSTPAAVLPLLYALRFGTRPDLVAGAIFITTLLSALSLTGLLYLLQMTGMM
ncbi:MAG: AEC family transporter [Desulfuromonadales bacterium]|nr:AEC family transporter [Desulfuromonadales bacterium]